MTGDVGRTGQSHGSSTSNRAAALKPPHLRAVIPVFSPTGIHSERVTPAECRRQRRLRRARAKAPTDLAAQRTTGPRRVPADPGAGSGRSRCRHPVVRVP
ncbi:hypothetical protein [Streptomyces sp. NPDC050263]|uniref:hypothetical protein n=1 Tax=Streptomyces sp. NPDC050263 TaxID=3155037 RepID=UPI0034237B67